MLLWKSKPNFYGGEIERLAVSNECESSERLHALDRATASEPGDELFLDLRDVDVLGEDTELFMHDCAKLTLSLRVVAGEQFERGKSCLRA